MSVRGVLSGALALIVLELLVTSSQASGRVTGFFGGLAGVTNWFIDAGVPGIPDRKNGTGSSPIAAAAAAATLGTPSSVLTPPSTSTAPALINQ